MRLLNGILLFALAAAASSARVLSSNSTVGYPLSLLRGTSKESFPSFVHYEERNVPHQRLLRKNKKGAKAKREEDRADFRATNFREGAKERAGGGAQKQRRKRGKREKPKFVKSTKRPTENPTVVLSSRPSISPSDSSSSEKPTKLPSGLPSVSSKSSSAPTRHPSLMPSLESNSVPSSQPSSDKSGLPSSKPSSHPSGAPSPEPSSMPSRDPSATPSLQGSTPPSVSPKPSLDPTSMPSEGPTGEPSQTPSLALSSEPTSIPSKQPSSHPSGAPSPEPSSMPSRDPSATPSLQGSTPPSVSPKPSLDPTSMPSEGPTGEPSQTPSLALSSEPTSIPSKQPSSHPSGAPSPEPSSMPSRDPSATPSLQGSTPPSVSPKPSLDPTSMPSMLPSSKASAPPSISMSPTASPSAPPSVSMNPSAMPSAVVSSSPSQTRSDPPSSDPSASPVVSPTVQDWSLLGSSIDGLTDDETFGRSVSFSADGRTLAVGAPLYNGGQGICRIYFLDDTDEWETAGFIEGETSSQGQAGFSVALSGDGQHIAVGAPYLGGLSQGTVNIYSRQGTGTSTSWVQRGSAILGGVDGPPNKAKGGDQFGYSVSLDNNGTTVAIGAIQDGSSSGYAAMYGFTGSAWLQLGQNITNNVYTNSKQIGHSVSLSMDGRTVAIGAPYHDTVVPDDGKCYIFRYDEATSSVWEQVGGDINGVASRETLGWSVDLSADGKTVVIGSAYYDSANSDVGLVKVYRFNSAFNNFTQLGDTIIGDQTGGKLGYATAIASNGNTVAVAAPRNDAPDTTDSAGEVRVFAFNDNTVGWDQVGSSIFGQSAKDFSGTSIVLSSDGSKLAIGSPASNDFGQPAKTDAGLVRVFEF